MTWVKLDDALFLNPKIGQASLEALGVYALSLTYAAHNLTDGAVPVTALHLVRCAEQISTELVEIGLWESQDDGSFQIHDYSKYNPSRRKVLADRKKTRERVARHRTTKQRDRNAVTTPAPVPVPHKDVGSSSSLSLLSEDPVVHTVVARFKEAATDNQHLEVDELKIARVLGEFPGMPSLQRESIHCAEWLGAQNGRKRRVAHLTLRNWLKREQPKEATRESRYTRPVNVSG